MNAGVIELETTVAHSQPLQLSTQSILIVEDHPMVADAMLELLRKMDVNIRTVVCESAQAALNSFNSTTNWFRILLDIDVPGAHGLSLVRQFWQLGAAPRCCVITGFERPDWIEEVRDMGMLGYLLKASPVDQFASLLESVLLGVSSFPAATERQVGQAIRLTRRQQDMLCLLHRGYSSKAIAAQLCLTEGTVNNHVSGLLRTLGVANRTHAVAKAIELGCLKINNRAM